MNGRHVDRLSVPASTVIRGMKYKRHIGGISGIKIPSQGQQKTPLPEELLFADSQLLPENIQTGTVVFQETAFLPMIPEKAGQQFIPDNGNTSCLLKREYYIIKNNHIILFCMGS